MKSVSKKITHLQICKVYIPEGDDISRVIRKAQIACTRGVDIKVTPITKSVAGYFEREMNKWIFRIPKSIIEKRKDGTST